MTAAGSDCLILPGARLATASTTGPGMLEDVTKINSYT